MGFYCLSSRNAVRTCVFGQGFDYTPSWADYNARPSPDGSYIYPPLNYQGVHSETVTQQAVLNISIYNIDSADSLCNKLFHSFLVLVAHALCSALCKSCVTFKACPKACA